MFYDVSRFVDFVIFLLAISNNFVRLLTDFVSECGIEKRLLSDKEPQDLGGKCFQPIEQEGLRESLQRAVCGTRGLADSSLRALTPKGVSDAHINQHQP